MLILFTFHKKGKAENKIFL